MFLQRLQSITTICKFVGCMPFSLDKTDNFRKNATALIFSLPYYVLTTCCIFLTISGLNFEFDDDGYKLIEITDVIEVITMAIVFVLRSIYYIFKRQHLKNIIFKVSIYCTCTVYLYEIQIRAVQRVHVKRASLLKELQT